MTSISICDLRPLHFGGSPRIYAGEERFSAPKKVTPSQLRFSAGPSSLFDFGSRQLPHIKIR
jgi:hypothetical protein